MENKERFVSDLLFHTRNSKIQWSSLSGGEIPRHIVEIQTKFAASGFIARSGERDCCSYYILKVNQEAKEEYIFFAYVNGVPSFFLRQREMENPFTLKALYDIALTKNKADIFPTFTDNEPSITESDWRARAIAAEREVRKLRSIIRNITNLIQ